MPLAPSHEEPLDDEERQLIRELEAGEWVPDPNFIRTDEHVEAISALETVADGLGRVQDDPYRWKWVILALHSTVQGMMVLALKGANGLRVPKSEDAERRLAADDNGERGPENVKMDSFLDLYEKTKDDHMMCRYVYSRKFTPQGTQGRSIKTLDRLRNRFVHFLPCAFSLVDTGLPEMTIDCLNVARFLAYESRNIDWPEGIGGRLDSAFAAATQSAQKIKTIFASEGSGSNAA